MTAALIPFPRALAPSLPPLAENWDRGDCPHCHTKAARYDHETFGCKQERNG